MVPMVVTMVVAECQLEWFTRWLLWSLLGYHGGFASCYRLTVMLSGSLRVRTSG